MKALPRMNNNKKKPTKKNYLWRNNDTPNMWKFKGEKSFKTYDKRRARQQFFFSNNKSSMQKETHTTPHRISMYSNWTLTKLSFLCIAIVLTSSPNQRSWTLRKSASIWEFRNGPMISTIFSSLSKRSLRRSIIEPMMLPLKSILLSHCSTFLPSHREDVLLACRSRHSFRSEQMLCTRLTKVKLSAWTFFWWREKICSRSAKQLITWRFSIFDRNLKYSSLSTSSSSSK